MGFPIVPCNDSATAPRGLPGPGLQQQPQCGAVPDPGAGDLMEFSMDFPGFLYRDEWELTWIYWDFIGCDGDF